MEKRRATSRDEYLAHAVKASEGDLEYLQMVDRYQMLVGMQGNNEQEIRDLRRRLTERCSRILVEGGFADVNPNWVRQVIMEHRHGAKST